MTSFELSEMIKKLPNQLAMQQVLNSFSGKSEKVIMELTIPLLDECECRRRIALIEILSKKINKHAYLLAILEIGYKKHLVSEIGSWINLIEPKIGLKKLIMHLASQSDKKAIDIALYKLAFLGNSKRQLQAEKLIKEAGLKPYDNSF